MVIAQCDFIMMANQFKPGDITLFQLNFTKPTVLSQTNAVIRLLPSNKLNKDSVVTI
jgi:hypothetical protein